MSLLHEMLAFPFPSTASTLQLGGSIRLVDGSEKTYDETLVCQEQVVAAPALGSSSRGHSALTNCVKTGNSK